MRKLLYGVLGLALFLGTSLSASAENDVEQAFQKADTNGDKLLSLEEFKTSGGKPAQLEKRLKKFDKDSDGSLSLAEFKTLKASTPAARADAIATKSDDRDSQGKVTLEEFIASAKNKKKAAAQFKKLDLNGDQRLSAEELKGKTEKTKGNKSTTPVESTTPLDSPQPAVVATRDATDRDPLAVSSVIDQEINRLLAERDIPASRMADDFEFIRRLSLDLRGQIPSASEVIAFAEDRDPDKRKRLIDRFLADPDYGEHFAIVWYQRMIKEDSDNAYLISDSFRDWLADRFNRNQNWDRLVTDILTASGKRDESPATVFWLANIEGKGGQIAPNKVAVTASRMFLGVKLECCECHNHPFDKELKQADFWAMAAFFTGTHTKDTNKKTIRQDNVVPSLFENGTAIKYPKRLNKESAPIGSVVIPDTEGKTVEAKFLLQDVPPAAKSGHLRSAFATWLTAPENPYFAKSAVNRLWSNFFGRGIIDPADDLRSAKDDTPHLKLLDLLTREFVASGFDQKHLIRCICNTQAYQHTSEPLSKNESDEELYSHARLRIMSADVLFDSLTVALDHQPAGDANRADRPRRKQKARESFLKYFHSEADDDAAVMEDYTHGIPQVLRLMNSDELNNTRSVMSQLAQAHQEPTELIKALYLRVLSRYPRTEEIERVQRYLTGSTGTSQGAGDVLWALLNSSEFLFNH